MKDLSDTIQRFRTLQRIKGARDAQSFPTPLREFQDFGPNPGNLRALAFAPADLRPGSALVVVLHGCTQSAQGYDYGAGWSEMARRQGFAVLCPTQARENNPNLCFNWFNPNDVGRHGREARSILRMTKAAIARFDIDPAKVFITGLSAGGAMSAAMLASFPEVFAAGAVIAGLPYGCASTVPEAFERMRGQGIPSERHLQGLLRSASDHAGPWPRLSVWHGTADHTVVPANAAALIGQWSDVHGVETLPDVEMTVDGFLRRVWIDADGREPIEEYRIAGMAHGTPLQTKGADGLGHAGPFMLDVGISSTLHIARFFGLSGDAIALNAATEPSTALVPDEILAPTEHPGAPPRPRSEGVRKVIEDALRSAGLMK